MDQAILSRKALRAVIHAASRDETRGCLCGAYVEISACSATYVAMDGCVMLAARVRLPNREPRNTLVGGWVLPRGAVLDKRVMGSTRDADCIKLERDDEGCFTLGGKVHFLPLEGQFPDWRRYVPLNKASGAPAHISSRYVYACERAGAEFSACGENEPHFAQDGHSSPALVTYADLPDLFGVVMSMRARRAGSVPEWALFDPAN